MINLRVATDYEEVWVRHNSQIEGTPLVIFKWTWNYDYGIESPTTPVWNQLPKFLINFSV